eukprot:SAG11_NODE_774_length_7236_cov_2.593807_6_plen_58_part_00
MCVRVAKVAFKSKTKEGLWGIVYTPDLPANSVDLLETNSLSTPGITSQMVVKTRQIS